jgi:hypothetical protein
MLLCGNNKTLRTSMPGGKRGGDARCTKKPHRSWFAHVANVRASWYIVMLLIFQEHGVENSSAALHGFHCTTVCVTQTYRANGQTAIASIAESPCKKYLNQHA